MTFKKILCALSATAIAATSVFSSAVFATDNDTSVFDDLNQLEITAAMGAGYNIGNTLEASSDGIPSETAWGNPKVTKEYVHTLKEQGITTVRIPVSYLDYIGDADSGYKIDEDWLDRVQEVIDYAIDEGLYVITNIHGDGYYTVDHSWLLCAEDDDAQVEIKAKYAAVWKQIATRFKDYDEHLIFESMNEEFDGTYGGQKWWAYKNINAYNQIFVDTVRQTGGNNAKRWLLIPGWNTDIDQTVNPQTYDGETYQFEIPEDTYLDSSVSGKRIMVSVHYYGPWDFCGDGTSTKYSQWGEDADQSKCASYQNTKASMETQIKKVYDAFVSQGYPVVIGEYGCINKSSADPYNTKYRALWVNTLCKLASQYSCVPVYWDNGASSNSFGLINRSTCEVLFPEIINAMLEPFSSDADNLDRLIAVAEGWLEIDYTAESWAALQSEITAAKKVASNASASNSDQVGAYEDLQAAMDAMVFAEHTEEAVETRIKSVVYNITSSADLTYSYQYAEEDSTGDYPTLTVDIKEGTDDYDLTPSWTNTAFWNMGFATFTDSSQTVVVNSITINGYKFTSSDLKVGTSLNNASPGSDGILNIWQGFTGTIESDNKEACLVVTSSQITFCVYGGSTVLPGDINEDGETTIKDLSLMYKHINETKPLDDAQAEIADINGDGRVTIIDYSLIYKHINGTKPLY